VEDARDRLKRYQQQINQVSTQREYGALLQEIDTVKRAIGEAEERGLASLERSEALGRELEELRGAFGELDRRYSSELEKWEAEKPAVAAQVAELERKVEGLRAELPRNVVAQFDRLAQRFPGSALAPILKVDRGGRGPSMWRCGACNFRVRPQVVVEVRNTGRMVQCDSCHRILYLQDDV
jgi:hypothetical protein